MEMVAKTAVRGTAVLRVFSFLIRHPWQPPVICFYETVYAALGRIFFDVSTL